MRVLQGGSPQHFGEISWPESQESNPMPDRLVAAGNVDNAPFVFGVAELIGRRTMALAWCTHANKVPIEDNILQSIASSLSKVGNMNRVETS